MSPGTHTHTHTHTHTQLLSSTLSLNLTEVPPPQCYQATSSFLFFFLLLPFTQHLLSHIINGSLEQSTCEGSCEMRAQSGDTHVMCCCTNSSLSWGRSSFSRVWSGCSFPLVNKRLAFIANTLFYSQLFSQGSDPTQLSGRIPPCSGAFILLLAFQNVPVLSEFLSLSPRGGLKRLSLSSSLLWCPVQLLVLDALQLWRCAPGGFCRRPTRRGVPVPASSPRPSPVPLSPATCGCWATGPSAL